MIVVSSGSFEPLEGGDRPCYEVLMKPNPVRNNAQLHRFEMDTPAGVAVADYRIAGNIMTIFYTEVPLPLRGRGYGYHLVCGALQEARRLNLMVEPECGFVREVINNKPEFKDLLM
jgi:predicted GNAT family acetyltransferase